ncbi:54S ribosomal protein L8, mitochondrial [Xanthoria parietina]
MAGGALKYRHLSRSSSHRQALLRNLVTSLFTHESIKTTWPKAKEAQRLAEKLITLGKKNTSATRLRAQQIFYHPLTHLNTLFTTIRARYLNRPGGYTRVLRIEPLNKHHDQAPSAILELVDGPKDMRFHMTAKTLVRERASEGGVRELTARNVQKVTRYRENGMDELEEEVRRMEKIAGDEEVREKAKWKVDERPREGWKMERIGRLRQKT